MCVGGDGVQLKGEDFSENLNYGETILLPASLNKFELESIGNSELLEIYISN
jgi:phosphotransferase system IIA component